MIPPVCISPSHCSNTGRSLRTRTVCFLLRNMHTPGQWLQANCQQSLATRCRSTAIRWRLPAIWSVHHQQHRDVGCPPPPVDQPTAFGGRPLFQPPPGRPGFSFWFPIEERHEARHTPAPQSSYRAAPRFLCPDVPQPSSNVKIFGSKVSLADVAQSAPQPRPEAQAIGPSKVVAASDTGKATEKRSGGAGSVTRPSHQPQVWFDITAGVVLFCCCEYRA